jgi:hypothetical protein
MVLKGVGVGGVEAPGVGEASEAEGVGVARVEGEGVREGALLVGGREGVGEGLSLPLLGSVAMAVERPVRECVALGASVVVLLPVAPSSGLAVGAELSEPPPHGPPVAVPPGEALLRRRRVGEGSREGVLPPPPPPPLRGLWVAAALSEGVGRGEVEGLALVEGEPERE